MCICFPAAKIIIYKSFLRNGLSEFPGLILPLPVCLTIPILNASTSDKYTVCPLSETQLLHSLLESRIYLIAGDRTYRSNSSVEIRLYPVYIYAIFQPFSLNSFCSIASALRYQSLRAAIASTAPSYFPLISTIECLLQLRCRTFQTILFHTSFIGFGWI